MGLAFPAAEVGLELLGSSFVEPTPHRLVDVGERRNGLTSQAQSTSFL